MCNYHFWSYRLWMKLQSLLIAHGHSSVYCTLSFQYNPVISYNNCCTAYILISYVLLCLIVADTWNRACLFFIHLALWPYNWPCGKSWLYDIFSRVLIIVIVISYSDGTLLLSDIFFVMFFWACEFNLVIFLSHDDESILHFHF